MEKRGSDLQSIAVFEFIASDGKIGTATCGPGPNGEHAIKYVWSQLQQKGIRPEQVKRIYSEIEPCYPPIGDCSEFIQKTFPNAEVTYSFEQGDTEAEHRKSMSNFAKTLKRLGLKKKDF